MRVSPKGLVDLSIELVHRSISDAVQTAVGNRFGVNWSSNPSLRNELQTRNGAAVDLADPADFVRICGQHWRAFARSGPAWMQHSEASGCASTLHRARNKLAHSLAEADLQPLASQATKAVWKLLEISSCSIASQKRARTIHRRADRQDADDLRRYLVKVARTRKKVSYHVAAEKVGLDFDDKLERRFFVDALNDTADRNVESAEPLLCALVVDDESGRPTVGFWPRVGLTGRSPAAGRRAAHESAVARVWDWTWVP